MAEFPISATLRTALSYYNSGLNVMPLLTNGNKCPPKGFTWKRLMTERQRLEEVLTSFHDEVGIGIVCGRGSGNLEVLDFDDTSSGIKWESELRQKAPELADRLVWNVTPSLGFHCPYRCAAIEDNQQLARIQKGDAVEILIETRGQGGMICAPGSVLSPHRSGKPYLCLRGSLLALPTITTEERNLMLDLARSFNCYVPEAKKKPWVSLPRRHGADSLLLPRPKNAPWDDFNRRASWDALLTDLGWTEVGESGGTTTWRRPGKSHGVSATTGHKAEEYGNDKLYLFSGSVKGLEPNHYYTKFDFYCTFRHGGDVKQAAKSLAAAGYGNSLPLLDDSVFITKQKGSEHEQ